MIWDDTKAVGFDFETSGTLPEYALQPWRLKTGDFWATSMSLIRREGNQLIADGSTLFPTVDQMRAILLRAIAENWLVVTWNGTFDISILIAYGLKDLVYKVRWIDGMLLWKHLAIEPEYDLNRAKKRAYKLKPDAVAEFIPAFADTTGADEVDFHATDPESLAKLQHYNDRDSVRTVIIARMIWDRLTPEQQNAAAIEAECLPQVAEANLIGMQVDTLVTSELSAWMTDTARERLETLGPDGVTEKVVRSPKQLATLLFDTWGLPVLKENTGKTTGNVSRSTDKEVLHELAFLDPRCKLLKEYRESLNNRTKFAEALRTSADYNGDGFTRPSAFIFGTYTGRMTYASKQGKNKDERQTGFAIHQTKRGKDFRAPLQAPPGYTLVEFDAAGQEFRWMAVKSGDPAMLQLCLPGEDPHSFMAARIVGMDYHELVTLVKAEDADAGQNRYLGKVANLSLQYRTYPKTFRRVARVDYNIPMELPEAQRIHATYKRTYTEVPRYWDRAIQEAKQRGYVETLAGRRVQLVGNWGGSNGWRMESTALNYPIQGTGGDQKYLALKVLKDYLVTVGGIFAWDMHDGLYLYIPDNMVDRVVAEGRQLLNNLPYREAWGFVPPIPLPWDCKVGKSWGTLKERGE